MSMRARGRRERIERLRRVDAVDEIGAEPSGDFRG
jgi:hypothetical protein